MLLVHCAGRLRNSLWHPTAIPTLRSATRTARASLSPTAGGNVGDAIAPLVVGAALAVFSWRQVVVRTSHWAGRRRLDARFLGGIRLGAKRAQAETQSLGDYARGLRSASQPLAGAARPAPRSAP